MNSRDDTRFLVALMAVALLGCGGPRPPAEIDAPTEGAPAAQVTAPSSELVLASDVVWEHLNPARGDKAPQAGTLWGDRNGEVATGYLLRPADGFRSPPHVHNVSYRGLVIRGLIHNDDPAVEDHWMPAGSYWTQPKGDVHITAAKGSDTLAYIEIDEGPYLVLPVEEAFESGEQVVAMDASEIVWTANSQVSGGPSGAERSPLWGDQQDEEPSGTLVKLPPAFSGELRSRGSVVRAVVIQGEPQYRAPGGSAPVTLEPGSYFSSKGPSVHDLGCASEHDCIIYVRAAGEFEVTSSPQ